MSALVVMSAEELEQRIEAAVSRAIKGVAKASPVGDILTLEQCAQLLGVKPATVRYRCREKGLPHRRPKGTRIYTFVRADVEAWRDRK